MNRKANEFDHGSTLKQLNCCLSPYCLRQRHGMKRFSGFTSKKKSRPHRVKRPSIASKLMRTDLLIPILSPLEEAGFTTCFPKVHTQPVQHRSTASSLLNQSVLPPTFFMSSQDALAPFFQPIQTLALFKTSPLSLFTACSYQRIPIILASLPIVFQTQQSRNFLTTLFLNHRYFNRTYCSINALSVILETATSPSDTMDHFCTTSPTSHIPINPSFHFKPIFSSMKQLPRFSQIYLTNGCSCCHRFLTSTTDVQPLTKIAKTPPGHKK